MPLSPAAFIDRDGVINEDRAYVSRPEDFHLLPGVGEGLRRLRQAGYRLVVVTNQSGIARGYYTEADYHALTEYMRQTLRAEGVELEGVYHCPHHPTKGLGDYRQDCDCRKPRPGLLLKAREDLGLDLGRSLIIGDKPSDVEAGRAAGLALCLLVRSGQTLPPAAVATADGCFEDLRTAAAWVAEQTADRHP